MKLSVVIERLGYEASAGRTTYGTSLAAFSLFLGWGGAYAQNCVKSGRATLGYVTVPRVSERQSY